MLRDYKELEVWRKSFKLVLEIYKATECFPKTEIYGLTSQMRRAACSIPSNIAEGYRRTHRAEYLQFLSISLGSAAELETQWLLADALGYSKQDDRAGVLANIQEVIKMTTGLMNSLKRAAVKAKQGTILLLLVLTLPYTLTPLPCLAAGVGTTGAQFLKVGVGAKELSMGSAASVLTQGANAVNWNPAGMAGLKERSMTASYNMLFIDESQGFVGYASPLKGNTGVIGFGVNYLTVTDIEKRAGDTETADSKFDNNNTAASLSYARAEVSPNLSLGASLKYIQQKLDTQNDKAVAIDLGSSYKINSDWTAAFTVRNFGTKIGPDKLPLTLKGGAATGFLEGKLSVAADLDWLVYDERFYVDLGADYALSKHLSFRAGYQVGHSQDELNSGLVGLGAGLGLKLDRMSLDYAYVPFGDLGDTHRMTFGFNF